MITTRTRPWALLVVAGLGAAAACEPGGTRAPSRVPGDTGFVPGVPYPLVDAERIEGAGRAVLAQATFVQIGLGGPPDDRDHALPELVAWDGEGPLLVAHHVEPIGPAVGTWQQLRRLAFGRELPEPGRAAPVDAAELEALGLRPPAGVVWLVGPRGSCRAEVGAPVVAALDATEGPVTVSYVLDGCAGRQWAQIGILADALPVDFRWVPAVAWPEVVIPRGHRWDDPLAPLLDRPAWSHAEEPGVELIRVREIPGTSPRVLQVHRAWLSESPQAHDGPWCELPVAWSSTDGWDHGTWIDAVSFSADAVGPFLLGAFVNGEQVDALVYDDRLDGLVVVPPGPLDEMDDPAAWHNAFVVTGRHDPAAIAAWGVEPARGPLPVGPACERDEPEP